MEYFTDVNLYLRSLSINLILFQWLHPKLDYNDHENILP